MKAIAAMSRNRVIGRDNQLPWHLPEDFRWFKETTMGGAIVMGRKTFESFRKPLPGRLNVVATRQGDLPDVEVIRDLSTLDPARYAPRTVWIIGGAEVYRQMLPRCTDLYLTVVDREVEGDAFFPPFEDQFTLVGVSLRTADFEVRHYRHV